MNPLKKVLLALAAAFVLLLLVLWLREARHAASLRPAYVFDTTQASAITRLAVTYQEDSSTIVRVDGRWVVLPDSFPADTAKVRNALHRLLRVEDKERVSVSTDSARLMEFGLHPGEVKSVTWTDASGATTRIYVGNISGADFSSTFWKREDMPDVYRTPGSFTFEIPARATDWKDKTLFPHFEPSDVQAVEVEWRVVSGDWVSYRAERTGDSTFRLTAPREADAPGALEVFRQSTQLIIDEHVDPADPALLFLDVDDAVTRVRITLRDGVEHALEVATELDGQHFARHPVHPSGIIKVARWRLDALRVNPDSLLTPPASRPIPALNEDMETVDVHEELR